MRHQIAHYRLERAAQAYCADLTKVWPMYEFRPVQHPRDFGWAVALFHKGRASIQAYVGRRPKPSQGGLARLGYTGN